MSNPRLILPDTEKETVEAGIVGIGLWKRLISSLKGTGGGQKKMSFEYKDISLLITAKLQGTLASGMVMVEAVGYLRIGFNGGLIIVTTRTPQGGGPKKYATADKWTWLYVNNPLVDFDNTVPGSFTLRPVRALSVPATEATADAEAVPAHFLREIVDPSGAKITRHLFVDNAEGWSNYPSSTFQLCPYNGTYAVMARRIFDYQPLAEYAISVVEGAPIFYITPPDTNGGYQDDSYGNFRFAAPSYDVVKNGGMVVCWRSYAVTTHRFGVYHNALMFRDTTVEGAPPSYSVTPTTPFLHYPIAIDAIGAESTTYQVDGVLYALNISRGFITNDGSLSPLHAQMAHSISYPDGRLVEGVETLISIGVPGDFVSHAGSNTEYGSTVVASPLGVTKPGLIWASDFTPQTHGGTGSGGSDSYNLTLFLGLGKLVLFDDVIRVTNGGFTTYYSYPRLNNSRQASVENAYVFYHKGFFGIAGFGTIGVPDGNGVSLYPSKSHAWFCTKSGAFVDLSPLLPQRPGQPEQNGVTFTSTASSNELLLTRTDTPGPVYSINTSTGSATLVSDVSISIASQFLPVVSTGDWLTGLFAKGVGNPFHILWFEGSALTVTWLGEAPPFDIQYLFSNGSGFIPSSDGGGTYHAEYVNSGNIVRWVTVTVSIDANGVKTAVGNTGPRTDAYSYTSLAAKTTRVITP